jgi:hypothetical protein
VVAETPETQFLATYSTPARNAQPFGSNDSPLQNIPIPIVTFCEVVASYVVAIPSLNAGQFLGASLVNARYPKAELLDQENKIIERINVRRRWSAQGGTNGGNS